MNSPPKQRSKRDVALADSKETRSTSRPEANNRSQTATESRPSLPPMAAKPTSVNMPMSSMEPRGSVFKESSRVSPASISDNHRHRKSRHERKSDIIGAATVEKLINRLFFSGRSAGDAKEFLQLLDIRTPESSDIGYKWHLSIIALEQYGRRFPFAFIGFYLLKPLVVPAYCKENTLIRFLHSLSRLYLDNPYHNDSHGGAVAHKTVSLIRLLNFEPALSDLDMATVIVASLGHDAGHFARTNNFLSESRDPLSLIYNDNAVLENYHSYLLFSVLANKHSNILSGFTNAQFKRTRKLIIDIILTTDMARHFDTVKEFAERAMMAEYDARANEADMWMTLKMCVKMADIGHAALEWRDHCQWSLRLTEELYSQGEEEAALGLPISQICDRSRRKLFATDQMGFLKYVVLPLGKALQIADSTNNIEHVIIRRVKRNLERWRMVHKDND